MPRIRDLAIAVIISLQCVSASFAFETVRDQEIAQCLPGEVSTWGDAQDRPALHSPMVFVYSPTDAPAWFDEATVVTALQKAAETWSQCSIPTRAQALVKGSQPPAGAILVQWSEEGSRHNFGLANLSQGTLSLGPAAFVLLRTRNPAYDSRQTLQMVISHEMGHLFGVMAHSRRCVDVTSYYDNGKGEKCHIRDGSVLKPGVEYRSVVPTACDIQRCRAANGFPSLSAEH